MWAKDIDIMANLSYFNIYVEFNIVDKYSIKYTHTIIIYII